MGHAGAQKADGSEFFTLDERGPHARALGSVADGGEEAKLAAKINGADRQLQGKLNAVFTPADHLRRPGYELGLACLKIAAHASAGILLIGRRHQGIERLPDDFLVGVTEYALGSRVEERY